MQKPVRKSEQGKTPPIVKVTGENGDEVVPPPPEVLEPIPS